MDSKTFRLSILAILSTIALIAVVVYAANREKINSMIGSQNGSDQAESLTDEETTTTEYGEQIGDDLKGFLTASDFFDKSEQRPSVVVVVDNVPVPANAEAGQTSSMQDNAQGGLGGDLNNYVPDEHGMLHDALGASDGNAE